MIQEKRNDFVRIYLENDVVIVDFLTSEINLEQAKQTIDLRLELIQGKSYPVLVDGRKVVSIDKQSRDCFSSQAAMQGVNAGALLISSTFNRFLGNFFLRVAYKKKKLPTRLFTSKDEALRWLNNYK